MTNPSRQSEQEAIETAARAWARRVAEDGADDAFVVWRDSDPRHESAFWDAWIIWRGVGETRFAMDGRWRDEAAVLASSPKVRFVNFIRARPVRFGVPAAIAASLFAMAILPDVKPDLSMATAAGRTQSVSLADGSLVTVGASSRVKAFIHGGERRVELAAGQAFFEVAKDPNRPFIVRAGNAEIRVTGTKFDVKRVGADVEVAVLEGRVEVRRAGLLPAIISRAPDRVLTAGLQTELRQGRDFAPASPAQTVPGDWRSGRLFYIEAPLGNILADVERYTGTPLRAGDSKVADLPLTASFRAGQLEQLIGYVEASLPLIARRDPDGGVTFVQRGGDERR